MLRDTKISLFPKPQHDTITFFVFPPRPPRRAVVWCVADGLLLSDVCRRKLLLHPLVLLLLLCCAVCPALPFCLGCESESHWQSLEPLAREGRGT